MIGISDGTPNGLRGFLMVIMVVLVSIGGPASIQAQQPAPEFSLSDLSGNTVSLGDFRGHLVVLDFWATWCIPCRKSLPELAALDKKYRGQGVVVLGLAIDNPDSFDDNFISNFIKKYDVEYTILRANEATIAQYLGTDNPSIPTLFIIDGQGQILEKHEGIAKGKLEGMIARYLK